MGLTHPAAPYVAPFAVFMFLLAGERYIPLGIEVMYPIRILVVSALLLVLSRDVVDLRPRAWLGSVLLGAAVFVIWIGPDTLWPAWRSHWLFHNSIVGEVRSSVPDAVRGNLVFIVFRTLGCAVVVPIFEEIFWRGWLARWLVDSRDFRNAPLGAYTPAAFWIGSALFAVEHGPYWDVGLLCGILYNWWMIRTRSLADCILTHAVTNACLSAWVLARGQWQYWM